MELNLSESWTYLYVNSSLSWTLDIGHLSVYLNLHHTVDLFACCTLPCINDVFVCASASLTYLYVRFTCIIGFFVYILSSVSWIHRYALSPVTWTHTVGYSYVLSPVSWTHRYALSPWGVNCITVRRVVGVHWVHYMEQKDCAARFATRAIWEIPDWKLSNPNKRGIPAATK